jgi:hypothetical protein
MKHFPDPTHCSRRLPTEPAGDTISRKGVLEKNANSRGRKWLRTRRRGEVRIGTETRYSSGVQKMCLAKRQRGISALGEERLTGAKIPPAPA